jgi:hypothetical protein
MDELFLMLIEFVIEWLVEKACRSVGSAWQEPPMGVYRPLAKPKRRRP